MDNQNTPLSVSVPPQSDPHPNQNLSLPAGPSLGQKILSAFSLCGVIMVAGIVLSIIAVFINPSMGILGIIIFVGVIFAGHSGGLVPIVPLVAFGIIFVLTLIVVFARQTNFGRKTKIVFMVLTLAYLAWIGYLFYELRQDELESQDEAAQTVRFQQNLEAKRIEESEKMAQNLEIARAEGFIGPQKGLIMAKAINIPGTTAGPLSFFNISLTTETDNPQNNKLFFDLLGRRDYGYFSYHIIEYSAANLNPQYGSATLENNRTGGSIIKFAKGRYFQILDENSSTDKYPELEIILDWFIKNSE
jgi:hypothetical protein